MFISISIIIPFVKENRIFPIFRIQIIYASYHCRYFYVDSCQALVGIIKLGLIYSYCNDD